MKRTSTPKKSTPKKTTDKGGKGKISPKMKAAMKKIAPYKRPILLGAGALAAWWFFSKDKSQEYVQDTATINDPSNATVTKIAQDLHDAMKYSGTDEDRILRTLTNVDEELFKKVARRFGRRAYNKTLGNQTRVNPFSELDKYSLKEWLENELTASEYKTLKDKYPNSL